MNWGYFWPCCLENSKGTTITFGFREGREGSVGWLIRWPTPMGDEGSTRYGKWMKAGTIVSAVDDQSIIIPILVIRFDFGQRLKVLRLYITNNAILQNCKIAKWYNTTYINNMLTKINSSRKNSLNMKKGEEERLKHTKKVPGRTWPLRNTPFPAFAIDESLTSKLHCIDR